MKLCVLLCTVGYLALVSDNNDISSGLGHAAEASEELKDIQDEYWLWRMETTPSYASYFGYTAYNDLVQSFNYTDFEVYRTKTESFLSRLEGVETSSLSAAEKISYGILKDTLETYIEGSQWALYGSLSPLSFLGGLHLSSNPGMAATSTRGDFENYIARLNAVPTQVNEIIEMGRLAINLNRTLHSVSMLKVPGQFDAVLLDATENSPAYSPFKARLDNSHIPHEDRDDLRTRGFEAVEGFLQAYRQLKDFIVNEYIPNTRTDYGVYAWDPTGDYYRACLKWHLSFEMSPEDVHRKGLQEVERIHGEMMKIVEQLEFTGTIRQFFDSLENDPRFYSNDTEAILAEYRKVVFERIDPNLHKYFRDIPGVPLEVAASATDGIGGGYSAASEDRPGRFIINLFRPDEVPFFEMMALSLHEASPGHHMQHSYSMLASLPDFRKTDILSFYNPPNFFPFYSAYQEGWALYSEYLGEEMNMYKDEYEMMGRYSYEILRAVRLVVDTGLHYYKWDRELAIEYMTNYTAFTYAGAANEIDRYITWPGQACAYKLGEIKIKELRKKAETELGVKFDLKEFHYLLLENGVMPMSILETMVESWIADTNMRTTTVPPAIANGCQSSVPRENMRIIAISLASLFHIIRFK